jgi:hypothetical protein
MLLEISPVALHLHLEGQSILLSGTCGTCGIVHIVSLPSLFSGSTCRKPSSNDVRQLRMSGKAMENYTPWKPSRFGGMLHYFLDTQHCMLRLFCPSLIPD